MNNNVHIEWRSGAWWEWEKNGQKWRISSILSTSQAEFHKFEFIFSFLSLLCCVFRLSFTGPSHHFISFQFFLTQKRAYEAITTMRKMKWGKQRNRKNVSIIIWLFNEWKLCSLYSLCNSLKAFFFSSDFK